MKQYSFLLESTHPANIQGLKEFYLSSDYGTVINGKKYTGKQLTFKIIDKAHLLYPWEQEKFKIGTCYDTVGLSCYYMNRWNIEHRSYLQTTRKEYDKEKSIWNDPTHTFLIYLDKDEKWRWLEGSWGPYMKNNLTENNPDDLVLKIKKLLEKEKHKTCYIKKIKKYPKFGLSYHEFYKELMT